MKIRDLLTGVGALAVLAIAAWVWLAPAGSAQAPALTLTSAREGEISLGPDYRRPLLVTFWATTCTTCIKEMPELAELYRDLGPRGLDMVGIAMYYDPPIQVINMIEQRQIPYPVALDLNKAAMRGFGMEQPVTPTTYLVAPGGTIVFRKVGLLDMEQLRTAITDLLPPA